MRMTPLVGRKVWFAPRRDRLGWGWAPVSWEGWVVLVVTIAVALASSLALATDGEGDGDWPAAGPGVAAIVLFLAACVVKGTSPGSRRQRAEYDSVRAEEEQRSRAGWLESSE